MERYIFLSISIIFVLKFLISKEVFGSIFSFMGIVVSFGLFGLTMGAYYFSYTMIFLGLIGGVVIFSFEHMLIEKRMSLIENEDKKQRGKTISGLLLFLIFLILVSIFKKNEAYFTSEIIKTEKYKDIFEMIKNDYFASIGLMMVLVFLSLISINLITKKEK